MTFFRKIIGALGAVFALSQPLWGENVTIFAAASLKTALDEVIVANDLDAVAVYGGSAAIARQIAQGADADIVILAHRDWMDWLAGQGRLASGQRCDLMGNELVLAGARDADAFTPDSAGDLIAALKGGRLAVGQLDTVPAGQYTAAFLSKKGWLDALRPHLAQTTNVRLALALVARAEAPFGFVYASDIAAQPRVRTVFRAESGSYPEIRYPMAITGAANAKVKLVWNALSAANEVFQRNGFSLLGADDPKRCKPL